jgi:hypothetical protein
MKLSKSNVKRFFDFCNERHAIYLRRQRGDTWPWTDDEILQKYKFTNIYRELDAGTIWLREHIREPYADDAELFFNIAMYRRYNRIECAEFLGYIHSYSALDTEADVEEYKRDGGKVFTSAYMTCAGIRDADGTLSKSKVHQIFYIGFGELWDRRHDAEPQPGDSLESAFNRLLAAHIPSFGPFIAYEVVSDLRWTRYLENAPDILTWANTGPGAARGIGRILGYDVKWHQDRYTYEEFVAQRSLYQNHDLMLEMMQKLLHISPNYLADWMPPFEMREIEHSLCEFDKYERARLGEGRPKQQFTPPHMRK